MTCESSIRSELIDLLKSVGHRFGLRNAPLTHLLWLVERTRVRDWVPGRRAVVYISVAEIAARRGITTRQVNNHERAIARAFGISVACPGCRRYGHRDPATGHIITASGIELTALHQALPVLRQTKAELDELDRRRRERKRELTAARGRVRSLATAVFTHASAAPEQIAAAKAIADRLPARIPEGDAADVVALEQHILDAGRAARELEALLLVGKTCGSDVQTSDMSEENFRHLHPSLDLRSSLTGCGSPVGDAATRKPAGARREPRLAGLSQKHHAARPEPNAREIEYRGPAYLPPEATGAYLVRPSAALAAASGRFRTHLPANDRAPTIADIVEAARELRYGLGIGPWAWREACESVGSYAAALCLLIADRRSADARISSPGGYFRSMIRRAPTGGLHIDRSIYAVARTGKPGEISPSFPERPDAAGRASPNVPKCPGSARRTSPNIPEFSEAQTANDAGKTPPVHQDRSLRVAAALDRMSPVGYIR